MVPIWYLFLWFLVGGIIIVGYTVISALVRGYIKKLKDRRNKKDA